MPVRDTAWPPGTPCWVDYGAADVEAAKAFYAELLGWSDSGGDPEYGGYLTCEASGQAAAGMGPQQDPDDPPRWTTYFASDDAEQSAARITDAGGTVLVPPMEVGPMGTMVIALDPQGSPFGVWQSGQHTGVRIYNEPGGLIWNEAAVDDPAAARTFYGSIFDLTFDELPDMGGYATFSRGGDPLGGLSAHQPGMPKGWSTCFAVASADDAVRKVESGGGKVLMPAQDSPYGRFAVLQDPWGAGFSVMQPER
jgi:predicted enzyme related to lactoylglutathione lyase